LELVRHIVKFKEIASLVGKAERHPSPQNGILVGDLTIFAFNLNLALGHVRQIVSDLLKLLAGLGCAPPPDFHGSVHSEIFIRTKAVQERLGARLPKKSLDDGNGLGELDKTVGHPSRSGNNAPLGWRLRWGDRHWCGAATHTQAANVSDITCKLCAIKLSLEIEG